LAGIEPPLVGYTGIVDDYLSMETIRSVAERLRRGTVVLVGAVNTDVSALVHPRIALIGFRPYETMPGYLAAFDCCILPFQVNRLTTAVNPIKLREYLAAGRPVVSAPLPSVLEYADVVEVAGDPISFASSVERMLEARHDTLDARARRRERVAQESWDLAAARIRPILFSLAEGRVPA
jgi:glycosyltransferase involved in cell wall biosynthesis